MPGVASPRIKGVNSGYVPNFFDTMSMISVILCLIQIGHHEDIARAGLRIHGLWRETES